MENYINLAKEAFNKGDLSNYFYYIWLATRKED